MIANATAAQMLSAGRINRVFSLISSFSTNWNRSTRNAQPKYRVYRTRPFSVVPQPKSRRITAEKPTHPMATKLLFLSRFQIALTTASSKMATPMKLMPVGSFNCQEICPHAVGSTPAFGAAMQSRMNSERPCPSELSHSRRGMNRGIFFVSD